MFKINRAINLLLRHHATIHSVSMIIKVLYKGTFQNPPLIRALLFFYKNSTFVRDFVATIWPKLAIYHDNLNSLTSWHDMSLLSDLVQSITIPSYANLSTPAFSYQETRQEC